MKGTLYRLVLVILLLLVVAALAEERRYEERYEVTITLTNSQAKTVENAKGRNVVVELTNEQINTITMRALKDFDLEEEPLLMYPSFFCAFNDLREGHTVLLSIKTWNCQDPDNPRLTIKCISVKVIAP